MGTIDDDLITKIKDEYSINKSIWKIGKKHGLTGQRVHAILNANGICTSRIGEWSVDEILELRSIYESGFKNGDGKLEGFCNKHNRLKSNVCRKAKKMGLSVNKNRKCCEDRTKEISNMAKNWIEKKGHPKGMKGKRHTDEIKKASSVRSVKMWEDKSSYVNSDEYRQKLSDRASKESNLRLSENASSIYSRVKHGTIVIGGREIFVRSSWEANIAAYFEFLKQNKQIKEWEYEPTTFWFDKIKRGVRSYKPDFLITNNDESQYYEEVKGWMDDKSKTKLNRMRIYYPNIDIRVLGKDRYAAISKNKGFIKGWGQLENK
jgi:hypothetical protein